jgi:diaminopimelate decarboxylase
LDPAIIKNIQAISFHQAAGPFQELAYANFAKQVLKLQNYWKKEFEMINFGGALPNLNQKEAQRLLKALRQILGSDINFYFEPGRFWSEEYGHFYCSIENRKTWQAEKQIVINASKEAHFRWAKPHLNFANGRKVRIYGATCSETDYLGEFKVSENSAKIKFSNVSGYSWAWQTQFNGIKKAPIIFI